MKCLIIHLQPDRSNLCNETDVLEAIDTLCGELEVISSCSTESDDEGGPYTNVFITSDDLAAAWAALKSDLFEHEELGPYFAKTAIVTAEGDESWDDDYLLLMHYEDSEELDTF